MLEITTLQVVIWITYPEKADVWPLVLLIPDECATVLLMPEDCVIPLVKPDDCATLLLRPDIWARLLPRADVWPVPLFMAEEPVIADKVAPTSG